MALLEQLKDAQKDAMRAKDKNRLGTIRMALAAIKQREIDEKITLDDSEITAVLTKMVKQRRDAAKQYEEAGRPELAATENAEILVLEDFLPRKLTDEEIATLIDQAIESTGAANMQEMGKVMGVLKPQLQGRADMGAVSGLIRSRLS
ncbi:GatB/YqeY domain-containing protein [Flocculibacter collagenilyticus]|uniref:GatB/YqeY domain-containing protein n=1 Tax=Flocculibacter collagenilyticus TaxID=2744479 RepID=UPI0018F794A6|nr:GatB/YqeY domain-containing protein [Flocculibacter collagenilyticus]